MALQAKLVHGNIYTLNGGRGSASKTFKKGEWTPVTDKERAHLEEKALERIVVKQGGTKTTQFIPKFDFREGKESTDTGEDGDGAQASSRARKRSRSR